MLKFSIQTKNGRVSNTNNDVNHVEETTNREGSGVFPLPLTYQFQPLLHSPDNRRREIFGKNLKTRIPDFSFL
jgi:hypothetical protein